MKIVNASNGKFKITNSLFESIIKNNPELIVEKMEASDNEFPKNNVWVINKVYNEIYGEDCPKDKLYDINRVFSENKDLNKFRKELRNIKNLEDRNRSFEDLKNVIGEEKFRKLSKNQKNNFFKDYVKNGSEKALGSIGKELEKMPIDNLEELIEKCKKDIEKYINNLNINTDKNKFIRDAKKEFDREVKNEVDDIKYNINHNKREPELTDDDIKFFENKKDGIIEKIKKMYNNQENNDTDENISKRFDMGVNDKDISQEEFKDYINQLYLNTFEGNIEYANNAVERVLNTMKREYGKKFEKIFPNHVDIIKKYYDAVVNEINNFKEVLKKLSEENRLTEAEDKKISKDSLMKHFSNTGEIDMNNVDDNSNNDIRRPTINDFVDNSLNPNIGTKKISSSEDGVNNIKNPNYYNFVDNSLKLNKDTKKIANNENGSVSVKFEEMEREIPSDPDEYSMRFDIFQDSYITDESLRKLISYAYKYKNIRNETKDLNNKLGEESLLMEKIEIFSKFLENMALLTNSSKPKNTNESFKNNKTFLLNEDIKWNEEEKNNANKDINESSDAIRCRRYILGIDDREYQILKNGLSRDENGNINKSDDYMKIKKEVIKNKKSLLFFLSSNEWSEFENTLNVPTKGNNAEEKLSDAYNKFGNVVNMVEKYIFDSQVSPNVNNFYTKIKDVVKKRIITGECIFNDFGEGGGIIFKTIPGFLLPRLKEVYVDSSKNEGEFYRGVSAAKVYRGIPIRDFWKNAAIINCNTTDGYNNVVRAIGDVNRNELNIQQKLISTGLDTRTMIYTLIPNDKKINISNVVDRNGNKLFDIEKLSIHQKRILSQLKRKYFIIVTEGLINKGKLLSKIGGTLKNKVFNSNKTLSSFGSIK